MEKKHRCKLCFRSFANGRALGGHMRSHMTMLKFQDEEVEDFHSFSSTNYSLSSPSSEGEEEEEEIEQVKADFYERVSETEHLKQRRVRSKRVPRSKIEGFFQHKRLKTDDSNNSNSSLSSISDTTPEEQVARSLIMLSKDNWPDEYHSMEEGDSNSKSKSASAIIRPNTSSTRNKYRCGECNKLFKSYQALGGHRASHKKNRAHTLSKVGPTSTSKPAEEKVHKCPFCDRVFPSGQALGGHKRSHFIAGAVVQNPTKATVEAFDIDLNLPAPVDEEETSQVAISDIC